MSSQSSSYSKTTTTVTGDGGAYVVGGGDGSAYGVGGGYGVSGGYGVTGGTGGTGVSGSASLSLGGGSGYSMGSEGSAATRSSYKPISQTRGTFKDFQKKSTVITSPQTSVQGSAGLALLSASNMSMHTGVDTVKKGRAQEKKDLQELNERFASYIEKARFLEAQNKNLVTEIESLKGGSTDDSSKIKDMYEIELKQLRKLLNESEKSKGPLEIKIQTLEHELSDLEIRLKVYESTNSEYKATIDRQRKEIMGLESELVQLRRFRSTNEEDSGRYKDEINYVKEDLKKTKQDYEREALARINLEHDLQSLQETLEFERQVNSEEVKNLSGVAYRDTTKENQSFWQNEMGRALRDIQSEYENKLTVMKQEIEANYGLQLQEIRTSKTRENVETTHLREESTRSKTAVQSMKSRMGELEMKISEYEFMINQLRGDLEESHREFELQRLTLQEELTSCQSNLTQTLAELQSILDAKLGLELEICAYRKLLEFEETRVYASSDADSTISRFVTLSTGGGSSGGGSYGGTSSGGGSYGGTSSGGGSSGGTSSGGGSYGGGAGYGISTGGSSGVGISLSGTTSGGGLSIGGISIGGSLSATGGLSTSSSSEKTESESQRIKFRRTTKGNISIAEIDIHGSFILLENIGSTVEQLGGMVLKRTIDGSEDKITYTIPGSVTLKATQKLRICANGKKSGKGKELEIDEMSWGIGEDITTSLLDTEGEIKAQHIQELVR